LKLKKQNIALFVSKLSLYEFDFDAKGRKMAASFCLKCKRARFYKRKYDITISEYEELLAQQNNKCAICGTINPGNSNNAFCVDHDHKRKRGSVRGLLCNRCNRGMGMFDDNPERLVAAAAYLLRAKK